MGRVVAIGLASMATRVQDTSQATAHCITAHCIMAVIPIWLRFRLDPAKENASALNKILGKALAGAENKQSPFLPRRF